MNLKSILKPGLLVLAALFGIVGLALFFIVPYLVLKEVGKEDHLGRNPDGSLNIVMEKFRAPKYTILMEVWAYNVENAERVVALGEKPRVTEKGPYVFV